MDRNVIKEGFKIQFSYIHADPQTILPLAVCDVCGEGIYPGELVHQIDGYLICPDCFFDFVFDYFADKMIMIDELKENRH